MKKFLLFLSLTILGLTGCKKELSDSDADNDYKIAVSPTVINILQDATSESVFTITTEDPAWTYSIESSDGTSWLDAEQDFSTNELKVSPKSSNEAQEARSATITVSTKSGLSSVKATLTQLGVSYAIYADITTIPEISILGGSIEFTITSNLDYEIDLPSWVEQVTPKAVTTEDEIYLEVGANTTAKDRSGYITFTGVDNPGVKLLLAVSQDGDVDVVVPEDIQIIPSGAYAHNSEYQSGSGEITNSFDGSMSTAYHSRWWDGTEFPVVLDYYMPTETDHIDYILYRTSGGNGAFGDIELYYAERNESDTYDDSDFVLLAEQNMGMTSGDHAIYAPGGGVDNPAVFRFRVLTGSGGGGDNGDGFASCQEMEFYKYDDSEDGINAQILNVFTTTACTELRADYSESDLLVLPTTFQMIVEGLLDESYEAEFRIADYTPYTSSATWAKINDTNQYSILDNPTGIAVLAGETFHVFVGETHNNNISLLSVTDQFVSGETFLLKEGVNSFTPTSDGQLYLNYTVSDLSGENSKPITIHFPSYQGGIVTGYFNLEKHITADELTRIVNLNSYSINGTNGGQFTIQGNKIQMNIQKSTIKKLSAQGMIDGLAFWDEAVEIQWDIINIDESQYPHLRNNRQLLISLPSDGSDDTFADYYMYASEIYIHIEASALESRLTKESLSSYLDAWWGPAHELGHQNDGAFTWHGYTEASNNIFPHATTWYFNQRYNTGFSTPAYGVAKLYPLMHTIQDGQTKLLNFLQLSNLEVYFQSRPLWQLYVYNVIAEKDVDFYNNLLPVTRLFETQDQPQDEAMMFYKAVCETSGLDYTEFFEAWGWFNPINDVISQYGDVTHVLTEETVAAVQAEVKALGLPLAPPVQYIDDRYKDEISDGFGGDVGHYTTFRDNLKVSSDIYYTASGTNVTIHNGAEAVGFEVRNDITNKIEMFFVEFSYNADKLVDGTTLYAAQADGERIAIPKQ